MATGAKGKGQKKKGDRFVGFKKMFAGVSVMAFVMVLISGLKAQVSLNTIAYRAAIAMFAIYLVNRVLIKILASYEEMNSGKA